MTPEQALQFLDVIVSGVSMTRKDHETATMAVQVLRQMVIKSEEHGNADQSDNPVE